jgi:O-antigen ligase/tetratricopeptide (TPR) repeat protein
MSKTKKLFAALALETRARRGTLRSRARGLLSLCIFSALLVLIPLTALPYGTVDPMWEGLFECAIFSLAVLWALEGALGGSWFEGPYELLVPLLALAAYMLLQTVPVPWAAAAAGVATSEALSADPHATRLVFVYLLALLVAAWLLHKYSSSSRRARALAYTVICVGVASAIFGMLKQTTGRNVLEALLPRLGGAAGYAQFINRNHFAFLMEMGLGLALGIAVGQRDRRELVPAYMAPALPMAAALVLSNSRGGVLTLLCQILFLALCAGATSLRSVRGADERYPRERASKQQYALRAALVAGLLLAAVVGIVWVGGDPLADRVQTASGDFGVGSGDTSGARRLQIWRASVRLVEDSPLVGAGFGAYPVAVTRHHEASGRVAVRQAHNDYLELLASGGLVGAGLVAWFFALLVKRARSALRTPDHFRRGVCLGALTGLVGVAVHSVFDFGLHVGVNALCAVVLIVLATPTADTGGGKRERGSPVARPARRTAVTSVALLCVAVILWAGVWAFRAAVARTFADYALSSGRVINESGSAESLMLPADEAVKYSPGDPAGHFARAVILAYMGHAGESSEAARAALALRPRDFAIWLRYGQSLEEAGDAARAELAFREAVRLAPHYARPAWQLGNMLLRAGGRDEAFIALRRAAASDPALYPIFMQTLWHATGKEAASFARAARPETPEQTLAVVRFLVKSGAAADGLKALRESGAQLTHEARRSLVEDLINAEGFADAYEVWYEGRGGKPADALADGGFEGEIRTDEEGFGWRFARDARGLTFSLDSDSPREGERSLKVEYTGASDPSARVVSQLIPAEPSARYRLTFSARTKELVMGGPPYVCIVSAAKSGETLAAAQPLPAGTTEWRDISLEFNAPASGAVRVVLARQPCTSSPCPAFGSVWLDAFELSGDAR